MKTSTLRNSIAGAALFGAIASQAIAAGGVFKGTPCDAPGLREVILQQVNAARARGAVCGGQRFGAAMPVVWNDRLAAAAEVHSRDMAEQNYFSHADRRGQQAEVRAGEQGYNWRAVGENIAAGETYTLGNVVQGWMGSPAHCSNIMDGEYNEVAVACVVRPGSTYGRYWTMVLGRR